MSYKIEYVGSIKKQVKKIPQNQLGKILASIHKKLSEDPLSNSVPLKNPNLPDRRMREGDYRVSFDIDTKENLISVISIKHRKESYE